MPAMSSAYTAVVLCSHTGGAQARRGALMSQRRDGRGGHRACKIIHGDHRRQSRLDDFGDMLDLLGEGRDPGLLQVRNVFAHARRGRRGERDICGQLVPLQRSSRGLAAVDTRAGVVGAGSRTLPFVVATLGLLRSTPTDGVLKSVW